MAHGQAPVGHRALFVLPRDFAKRLLRLFVPEGVQQRDAPLKILLDSRLARRRKADGAEMTRVVGVVMMLVVGKHGDGDHSGGETKEGLAGFHAYTPQCRKSTPGAAFRQPGLVMDSRLRRFDAKNLDRFRRPISGFRNKLEKSSETDRIPATL